MKLKLNWKVDLAAMLAVIAYTCAGAMGVNSWGFWASAILGSICLHLALYQAKLVGEKSKQESTKSWAYWESSQVAQALICKHFEGVLGARKIAFDIGKEIQALERADK